MIKENKFELLIYFENNEIVQQIRYLRDKQFLNEIKNNRRMRLTLRILTNINNITANFMICYFNYTIKFKMFKNIIMIWTN